MGTSRHPEAAIGKPQHIRTCKACVHVVAVFQDMSTDWQNIYRVVTVTNDANEHVRALLHVGKGIVVPEHRMRKVRVVTDVDVHGHSPACAAAYERDAKRTNRKRLEEFRKQLDETTQNDISAIVGLRNTIFPFETPREAQDEVNRIQEMYMRTGELPRARIRVKPEAFPGFKKVGTPTNSGKVVPTAKTDKVPLDVFRKAGWTNEQLIEHGFAVRVQAPTMFDLMQREAIRQAAAIRRAEEEKKKNWLRGEWEYAGAKPAPFTPTPQEAKSPPAKTVEVPAAGFSIFPGRKSHSARITVKNIFDPHIKVISIEIRDVDGDLVYGGPLSHFQINQGGGA